MTATFEVVGTRLPKIDAPDKVSGLIQYGDDLQFPGLLVGAIKRSPHAHARILRIDATAAERLPGVKAVLHAGNVQQRPYGFYGDNIPLKPEIVRFIGDEVAAVAAVDEDTAARAIDLIEVEYEVLPAVFDAYAALQDDAPTLHPERGLDSNVSMRWDFDHGDVQKAESEAAVAVEGLYQSPLAAPAPIETHVTIAAYDPHDHVTIWAPIHMVFLYRKEISQCLGIPWDKITVIQPPVGGSFGGKIDIDPHDFITVMLARATRRPVKISFSREDEFVSTRTRQPIHFRMRTGADAEGNLLFRDVDIVSDNGAYNGWGSHAMLVAMQTCSSHYRVPNVRVRCAVAYTNKPWGGSVRGFGNPQATFAVEQQMEQIADALGIDPMDLRVQNAYHEGDVTPQGLKITSCGLDECLERVRKASDWDARRGQMKHLRRGLGAAAFTHVGGGARVYGSDGCGAMIKLDDSGRITLISGSSELGQGSETALAMIVAEELGVPVDIVAVVNSNTDIKPWDVGVHASRTTFIAGNAARLAAAEAKQMLFTTAASLLGTTPDQLTSAKGEIFVRDDPRRSIGIAKVARRRLLSEGGSAVLANAFYDPPSEPMDETHRGNYSAAYGFGAHVAEVEVDTETGMIRVLNLWTAHDVGRAINPMAVEGQIEGGAAMGVGLALSEELTVRTGEVIGANFHDYGIPTSVDVPRIHVELVETIDGEGPFGAKGVGEGGLIPVPAAVANAVADAVGIRPSQYPMRPWKVLEWLDGAHELPTVLGPPRD